MAKLTCVKCKSTNTKVIDSRLGKGSSMAEYIRRRRRCLQCGHRWTTIEVSARRIEVLLPKTIRSAVD